MKHIEYRIADLKYRFYRWWNDLWYPVSRFLFPRQKWLTKQIPNSWVDKDWLWELCLIEGLKHYVEQDGGDGGFKHVDSNYKWIPIKDDQYPLGEYWEKFHCECKYNYDLVTKTLPALKEQLELAWKHLPEFDIASLNFPSKPPYDRIYGKIDTFDKLINDLKTSVMIWCVNNRAKIWT